MPIPYYFETDCFNLNKNARLSNAALHRLLGLVEKMTPLNLSRHSNSLIEDDEFTHRLLKKIYDVFENINWSQTLAQASYAVFDTETTGLNPVRDKVIEIGCVLIEDECIQEEKRFVELVNPRRHITATASYITGITDGMVTDKRQLIEVLYDFLKFAGSRVLVAHCAPFDMAFLNRELGKLAPVRIYNPVIDTCLLARCLLPGLDDYSLSGLARAFKIEIEGRHTALGDSMMTAKLFIKLLDLLKKCSIKDLHDLLHYLQLQKRYFYPET